MDIVQLYQDYNVDFRTEGHKHCRSGWVNTACPYCAGNPGYHLGYDAQANYFYCWRCGWHPTISTIADLTNINKWEIKSLIGKYGLLIPKITKEPKVKIQTKAHRIPSNTTPLSKIHIKYLKNRGFNPEQLIEDWMLVGTGPTSKLDTLDYRYRILAPIIWEGEQVSFQTRDVTGKNSYRYKACPKDRELIHHKHVLYGKQEEWKDTGICVEGITDVWRLGFQAFSTFGIKYSITQVRIMAKRFKRIAVIFDNDPQAIIQSKKLVADLKFRGVDAWRVEIKNDPASMDQQEADNLVHQIIPI